ncbi:MAG: hypothetical protein ACI935_001137 [Moritella dasanensis]|jgi:hypothetical protein
MFSPTQERRLHKSQHRRDVLAQAFVAILNSLDHSEAIFFCASYSRFLNIIAMFYSSLKYWVI